MKSNVIRRIKVAHVAGWLNVGGKENGIVNLVNAMPDDIFASHVFVFKAGGVMRQRIDPSKCVVEELGDRLGGDPRLYWKLFKVFRRHRVHIAHTHAWGTLLEGVTAAKLARVPIIIHGEHGLIKASSKAHILAQRCYWRMADQVLSVSEVLRDDLSRRIGFPRERIRVLHNGVDLEKFEVVADVAEIKASLGIAAHTLLFGSVGRLVAVKDYANLIRAAKIVFEAIPNSRLVFIGDGPLRPELEAIAQEFGIASKMMILGRRKDVPVLLQALDVFVLSSVSEGMSNSILEAMAARRPVVATKVGGNVELVQENETGVLVPPKDPKRMAEAIISLLRSPARRRAMGEAGRTRVEERFALSGMIRRYEQLYVEMATKRFTFHPELQERVDEHFGVTHSKATAGVQRIEAH